MGPVRQNPIQRTVRTAHLSVLMMCMTSVHNTAQNSSDNLPSYHQTTMIAQMLSIGGKGGYGVWESAQASQWVQGRAKHFSSKFLHLVVDTCQKIQKRQVPNHNSVVGGDKVVGIPTSPDFAGTCSPVPVGLTPAFRMELGLRNFCCGLAVSQQN